MVYVNSHDSVHVTVRIDPEPVSNDEDFGPATTGADRCGQPCVIGDPCYRALGHDGPHANDDTTWEIRAW
jgi:hypothetical protein